ncbi:helix-turn-helix domain-containing protein [Microvirga sp. ACRRW]|nr:helix-turn-helix transcriptional regulator [Microvirga sp. ACRRW]MCG7392889.1 helix-turn-helix domain-containing protein [Microvirga sp. ACRRW]
MNPAPDLLKAARIALRLSQKDLAEAAGIGERSLSRMEAEPSDQTVRTQIAVQRALEAIGVEFLSQDGDRGPGFRLPAGWYQSDS